MTTRKATSLVLLAAVLFGTTGTAKNLGPDNLDPLAVGAARVVIGGGLLALWSWYRRAFTDRPKPRVGIVILSGIAVAGYQLCFFTGVDWAGVGLATVITIGSGPVWTGLILFLLSRRPPEPRWVLATGLAIVGCIVLVAASSEGDNGSRPMAGVLIALMAGLAYGIYTVTSSRLIGSGQRDDGAMGIVFGAGAVLSIPLLIYFWPGGLDSGAGLLTALYLGVIPTTVAYLLFGVGLNWLSAATVATLVLAEPVVATVLGMVVIGETITPGAILGSAIVLLGLAILALPRSRQPDLVTPVG